MKGLYILTLPFLWILQVALLVVMVATHISVAPIRALIYWGYLVQANAGWHKFLMMEIDATDIGLNVTLGEDPKEEI